MAFRGLLGGGLVMMRQVGALVVTNEMDCCGVSVLESLVLTLKIWLWDLIGRPDSHYVIKFMRIIFKAVRLP